jgi:PKD repeat protein
VNSFSQSEAIYPTKVSTAIYFDVLPSLKDLPKVDKQYYIDNWGRSVGDGEEHESKDAPNFAYWKDDGPDPVWQKQNGWFQSPKALINNYVGQSSPYLPSDANGTVGPNHYMQTVNTTFAVYDKVGNLVAGPTAMNTLFSGVPGSSYNDGDPLILFDEQAQKWLAVEFSISGSPYYMLIAVSQTNDPTGAWWRWSFVMNGIPDYEKMGIWHDGYYMGTNYGQLTSSYDDVYVFERSAMITGAASPQMVAFHNSNKPQQAFHCIMPLDADGASAPASSPGQFITINDNAWGGSDELRIYELAVNWTTPSSSTFTMTQQILVASFDSQFNETWGVGDIAQQGTTNLVDAQNYTLMTRGQYKNWGTSQSIVCCHTVDVDNTNHAGQRWYELEKTSQSDASWAIRQQGTYSPDAHSRFNGSVAINDNHEIALGYNVSSSSMSPNIRYTGQSASSNTAANGLMDIIESASMAQLTVQSQTSSNRWGDYSLMTVDPVDGVTFWYTNEYYSSGKKTQIMSFTIGSSVLTAQFSGTPTSVAVGSTVTFTNASYGPYPITSYSWTFEGGTPGTATGQGPHTITYNTPGIYDVSLTVGDGSSTDSEVKSNYISASYSSSGTYVAGDIPTDFGFQTLPGSSTCPGSLTVNIPAGATITSVDVQYQMTGQNSGYMSEQRSQLRCISTGGTNEVALSSGSGDATGTYSYSRTGLTIANGVIGGGNINFQLHAGRTWGGTGCSTTYNKVNNNTWIVTVRYTPETPTPPVANFTANFVTPAVGQTVTFSDASTNNPTSWAWSFSPANVTYIGGTSSSSQNPQVQFNTSGYYTVSLTVTNASGSDNETKVNYIHAVQSGLWTGITSNDWNTASNWDDNIVPTSGVDVTIPASAPNWPTRTGDLILGTTCNNITMIGPSELTVTGNLTIPSGKTLTCSTNPVIHVGGNWSNSGTFNQGTSTVEFNGTTSATMVNNTVPTSIGNFERSLFSVGMTYLTSPSTGPTGDNGGYNPSFGFTFNYDGTDYTSARICTNGWLAFGITTDTSSTNANLFTTSTPNVILAPWWDNLSDDATSYVYYKTEGNAPNRVFTTEWKGVLSYNASATERLNFQVKLYESTNVIEFHYGTVQTGTNSSSESASIGIEDGTGGSNHFIEATTGSMTTEISTLTSSSNWPTVNYRFTPRPVKLIFNNLTISKTTNAVASNSDIDVLGNFIIKPDGNFTNNTGKIVTVSGNTLFEASASGMASFINDGTFNVTGTTTVQQYLTSQKWHFVSPPVSAATINAYYDIYLKEYNEPSNTWTYLYQPTSMPMNVGQGYSAWAADDLTGTTTVSYTGTLTNSNINLNGFSYSPVTNPSKYGFRLIGNPYPCAIDWNTVWPQSNLSGWAVIYDNGISRGWHPSLGGYNEMTNGIIPSTQGFWVRATSAAATLTIPLSARVHNGQAFYKETQLSVFPIVRLNASGNGYTDETVITFHPEGTDDFDAYYDLEKFYNVEESPQLYSIAGNRNYGFNVMVPEYKDKVISIGFENAFEGAYILDVAVLDNLDPEINVYLEDILTGQVSKLSEGMAIYFDHNPINDPHRFNLHFKDSYFGNYELSDNEIRIYSFGKTVYIETPGIKAGQVCIYNMMGQEINHSEITTGNKFNKINLYGETGFYFVKVQTGDQLLTKKVFIR